MEGISTRLLTERLRLLEGAEIVYRDYNLTIPPQLTYRFAPRGQKLSQVLDTLAAVAIRWERGGPGKGPATSTQAAAGQVWHDCPCRAA